MVAALSRDNTAVYKYDDHVYGNLLYYKDDCYEKMNCYYAMIVST